MTGGPAVTVVIPVRDEAGRLGACLDALAGQDLPAGLVEVLVVDGGSTDATVAAARHHLAGAAWHRAEVLDCPGGDRPANLNLGLARAAAPYLVRVDARSRVPRHYVRACVELLEARPDVAVVGGRQRAVAASERARDVGVARALNNRWATGLARYRRSAGAGPADTVYLGAYRTGQVRAAGGWRAELAVNEDFDLNRRLAARGGQVWFDPDLAVAYLPRTSLAALASQYYAFGRGKARYWRLSGDHPRPRQLALLAAPAAAAGLVAAAGAAAGPVAALAALGGLAAAAAAVEVAGGDGPAGPPAAHGAALGVLACVTVPWLAGVVTGTLAPDRAAAR